MEDLTCYQHRQKLNEFSEAVAPLVNWLKAQNDPMLTAIVTDVSAQLVDKVAFIPYNAKTPTG